MKSIENNCKENGDSAEDQNALFYTMFAEINEQNYKNLLEFLPVPVFIYQNGRFIFANSEAAKLHGFDNPGELLNRPLSDFVHPEDLNRFKKYVIEDNSYDNSYRFFQIRIVRNVNEIRDLEMVSKPLIFKGGKVRLVVCIDRTDHHRLDIALNDNLKFMQTLLNTIPNPIFYKDTNYAYIGCNRIFSKIVLGLPAEAIVGKTVYDFPGKISDSLADIYHAYDQKLLENRGVQVYKARVSCADNELRDFIFYQATFNNANGKLAGIVGVMLDITELRNVEREFYQYQEQLLRMSSVMTLAEELDRRRIATKLHERIGQILAISKMKLGIIKKTVPSAELTCALDEIVELIGQTIQETRMLTFQLSPPLLHEVGLVEAIDWLLENINKKTRIDIRFEKDNQPIVLGERIRVLMFKTTRELLLNVVAHSGARNASVALFGEGEKIRIQVTDDGVGFDIAKIDQAKNSVSGFGLFSIRERMKHLNGSLRVDSSPGKGTKVTLIFPMVYEQKAIVEKV